MPYDEELQRCLICSDKSKFMISLQQTLADCEGLTVAEALEDLHLLTISDAANLHLTLCLLCVAKIQYCFEFKTTCRQIERILKTQSKNIFDGASIIANVIPIENTIKKENYDLITIEEDLHKQANVNLLFIKESQDQENYDEYNHEEEENRNFETNRVDPENASEKKSDHDIEEYSCAFCEKVFLRKGYLMKHFQIHTGKKSFACDLCDKSFLYQENLKQHRNIHTNEKIFTCSICQKTFKRQFNLERHFRLHTGVKLFKCPRCQQSFSRKTGLKKHLKIHKGEKRHSCDICDKSFLSKRDLKRHQIVHNSDKKYSCVYCFKKYKHKRFLTEHLRRHPESYGTALQLENHNETVQSE